MSDKKIPNPKTYKFDTLSLHAGYQPHKNAGSRQVPIYQTNHVLRSVEIPPGENEVIFEYDTNTWQKTRMLSRVSLLSVLLLLGIIFWTGKKEQIE